MACVPVAVPRRPPPPPSLVCAGCEVPVPNEHAVPVRAVSNVTPPSIFWAQSRGAPAAGDQMMLATHCFAPQLLNFHSVGRPHMTLSGIGSKHKQNQHISTAFHAVCGENVAHAPILAHEQQAPTTEAIELTAITKFALLNRCRILCRQVNIEVGFFDDPGLEHTFSALLYWRGRLIVPFLRFGTLCSCPLVAFFPSSPAVGQLLPQYHIRWVSALLYWHGRLIAPFLRFSKPSAHCLFLNPTPCCLAGAHPCGAALLAWPPHRPPSCALVCRSLFFSFSFPSFAFSRFSRPVAGQERNSRTPSHCSATAAYWAL